MSGNIDFQPMKDCWNMYDSYGEICVQCGCCSEDPKTRYQARLEVSKDHLEQERSFIDWSDDPELRAMQEQNVQSSTEYWQKNIEEYEQKLKELEGNQDAGSR